MPVFIDLPQVVNTSLKGIKRRDPDLRSLQYIQKDRKKLNHKLDVFLSLCFHKSDLGFHKPTKDWHARTKNPQTTHTHTHTSCYPFICCKQGSKLNLRYKYISTSPRSTLFPQCNSVNDAEVLFLAHKIYLFCNIAGTVW